MTKIKTADHIYGQLSTDYFNLVKPEPFPEEVEFYQNILNKAVGPSLYAMCGSGRLLIPLLSAGYNIEGVDYSPYMLECCRNSLDSKGLKALLYQQSIQEMVLERIYECIFIIGGSFQLIYPREAAVKTLYAAKKHLIEGGRLYIDTFIPWEFLYENAHEETFTNEIRDKDKTSLKIETHTIANKQEQLFKSYNTYSRLKEGRVIQSEKEVMPVLWYYHYETILLLESVGFKNAKVCNPKVGQHPELIIYEAFK